MADLTAHAVDDIDAMVAEMRSDLAETQTMVAEIFAILDRRDAEGVSAG